MEITSIDGKNVYSRTIKDFKANTEIFNLEQLKDGHYLINVYEGSDKVFSEQLVVK